MSENMKKINAVDGIEMNDTFGTPSSSKKNKYYDTEIIFRDPDTKEVMFKAKNKVVLAGGDLVARKLFDIGTTGSENINTIPTYNDELGLDDIGTEDGGATYDTAAKKNDPKVLLFCVGTDGCGTEGSQIYAVDYNSRIAPDAMIPFRYPLKTSDLDDEQKALYTGLKTSGNYFAYYFKRFTSGPTLIRQFSDGTPISSNVYEVTSLPVDCFVEVTLTITKEDLREYFIATSSLDQCRFNTISLCYAYPVQVDGIVHYADIRPLTKLNISNEYMIDVTKGVEIVYHVYF